MAHDVFISYSEKDKEVADTVCATLESHGIRCWIAPRDVLPSKEWSEAIIDAIEECRIMVLVFTSNANASLQIHREIERGANHGVAILPLRVENVLPAKALEYFIGDVQWLNAAMPPSDTHLKDLADTIKVVLAGTGQSVSPMAQEEQKSFSNSAHTFPEGTAKTAVAPKQLPPPRRFWGVRPWIWAAGAFAVLLLVALFVAWHLRSRSGAAASAQTAGNAKSLEEAMATLQQELGSNGTVSFSSSAHNNANGKNFQTDYVDQVSNVVANPDQCTVLFHHKEWSTGATKINLDVDGRILLKEVTKVVAEPESQNLTEIFAAEGYPSVVVTSATPHVTVLLVYETFGRPNRFHFADPSLAGRAAQSITQAIKLCGGTVAN